ncbi:energy transducer TonB [Novosphingobium sp. BL-8H]|uniref:energy transducer TonB n=1 Tax=Novosphingobium sp. BL-8H TaxID=3127640 RepID=UPI00375765F0
MSYVDRNSNPNQKFLTGGIVALIQGGVALALINGFAVTMLQSGPKHHTEGVMVHLDPPPPPPPQPMTQPEQPKLIETIATTTHSDIVKPTTSEQPTTVPTTLPTTTGTLDGDLITPFPQPSTTPSPRFQPRGAMPRNDPSSWITTQDYPTSELRAEHQGMVRFRVDVDARGRAGQCTILSSSGYSGLDEATCKYVSKRARFEPATNADGEAAAGSYMGTIRWIIPRD